MALPKEVAEAVLGTALQPLLQQRMVGRNNAKKGQIAKPQIGYRDLEMHRIVGTGQFGMVRVVRHIPSNQAYALKVWSCNTVHSHQCHCLRNKIKRVILCISKLHLVPLCSFCLKRSSRWSQAYAMHA